MYAELAIILFFVRNWSYSDGSDLIAEQHWRALRHPPCIRTFFVRQSVIGESPSLIQNVAAKWAEIGRCMPHIVPGSGSRSRRAKIGRFAIVGGMGISHQLSVSKRFAVTQDLTGGRVVNARRA